MKYFVVLISSLLLLCVMPSVRALAESSTIVVCENRIVIKPKGFRFRFVPAGVVPCDMILVC